MTTRTITVTVKNIGTENYTFYIGASVCGNASGSGCGLYTTQVIWDAPLKSLYLTTGQTSSVSWTWDDSGYSGTLYVIAKAWLDSTPAEGECLDGASISFTIKQIAADVTSISIV